MSDTADIDISHIRFSSTAFPSADDMKLWHSLTPQEQQAIIRRDIAEGLDGPAAERQKKEEILAAALARYVDAV